MRRCLIFILVLLIPALCFSSTRGISIIAQDLTTGKSGEVKLYNKSYAVIVGIDRYLNLPADKQLKNAVHDALGVAEVLRSNYQFDEIITFTDEQATKDNIMGLLTTDLPKRMNKEDALFVFWAGHGNQKTNIDGDLGYLIPYDGSVDAIYRNITMTEIRDTISKTLPAKHVFYVMDACYSGLLASKRSLGNSYSRDLGYLKEITRERVRQVLTAGSKGEEALDGGPKGHSVFTGRLIEALESAGDFVTASEIQNILKEKVYQDARARNHTQTPGFGTLYGSGDFVFVPSLQQKSADVSAELARLEQEMAELAKREAAAEAARDKSTQRRMERERQVMQAKIKSEQLRKAQFEKEARNKAELIREQTRLADQRKKQEAELLSKRSKEEERLIALKAKISERRQNITSVTSDTIEAAVSEIKRMSAEIDNIEDTFNEELKAGEKRITGRYISLISAVKKQFSEAKEKNLTQGEFETNAEFKVRKERGISGYNERISELESQQNSELKDLHSTINRESSSQTDSLRSAMVALTNKEYTLAPQLLTLDVGRYNLDKSEFSFTLKSSQKAPIQLAMNGTINLPRNEAKTWKQNYTNGFVQPQVKASLNGDIIQVALTNDVSSDLFLVLANEQFMTRRELRERLQPYVGELVEVPGGCFQMGDQFGEDNSDEKPVHEVCVDSFSMGKYEMTQGQWRKVMGRNPSSFKNDDSNPVEQVSWNDVQEFIQRLNRQTGKTFRLPTEAEWEYAARSGGKKEKYSGGAHADAVAWYKKNSDSKTHPVGQKQPNGLGLYDMSGNVWEWCQDWYDKDYYGKSSKQNPQGPSGGSKRGVRGGSWGYKPGYVLATIRGGSDPDVRGSDLGFRLVTQD